MVRSSTPRRLLVVPGARLVLLIGAALVAEAGLQVAKRVSRSAAVLLARDTDFFVLDDRLGWRGNPQYLDHDPAGYRNAERPERASVVVLGDSLTYGVGVERSQTWPAVLAATAGFTVYNMAFPSFCPAHNLLQLDEALALHPDRVVVSVYFGNDLFDAFLLTKGSALVRSLVPSALVDAALERERRGPISGETAAVHPYDALTTGGPTATGRLRDWLSMHSALYGLARAFKRALRPPATAVVAGEQDFEAAVADIPAAGRPFALVVDRPDRRSILTPRYRGLAVDLEDARIREGLEVAKASLAAIARRTRGTGARLLVVLIPTKESVFWPATDRRDPALAKTVADEQLVRDELIASLHEEGIDLLDALEPLRAMTAQPFFASLDGHLNPAGHRTMAALVEQWLVERHRDDLHQQDGGTRSD